MSFSRRSGSGCPRQTSRGEDHHIVENARVQPTASLAAMQEQASHEFERTREKVATSMEQNASRHHTELVYLNGRSYRIVLSR
ncbi:hypothetical protein TNCV_2551551 [Trichonephila clavipes]|nr:hypothetical protein TNCV_2551551 [Trichonephila clavipes]